MNSLHYIFRNIVNKECNAPSYAAGIKLATYINKFVESIKDINIEYDNILIAQKKSQEYIDNKYKKQKVALEIKEIEVPSLDMSILEGYNLSVAHLCMLQKLSEVKDGE